MTGSGLTTRALARLDEAASLLDEVERDDLRDRVRAGATRLANPSTVVCVVGEFKQGKSLLINAILGAPVCPVDDDLATSVVTAIQHAERTNVVVLRREAGQRRADEIDPRDLARYVTEAGNPANERGVDQVAIGLDHPLLREGFAFVDTPGVGGLGAGHAAATLAFLPYADALVLVSDASSELSGPELDFLGRAIELCPAVVLTLSKTDLFGEWRAIAALDEGHLGGAGLDVALLPTSAAAAIASLELDDPALMAESGVDDLVEHLRRRALDRARSTARRRSCTEARDALSLVVAATEQELRIAEQGEQAAQAEHELAEVLAHLDHLRGPGSRWGQRLGDVMSDIANSSNYEFRLAMRSLTQEMDLAVEELQSAKDWDDLAQLLQTRVADAITAIFTRIDAGVAALRVDLVDLLELEALPSRSFEAREATQTLDAIWLSRIRDLKEDAGAKKTAGQAVTALRGAQSGIMLMSLLGKFLPAGAAALMFSNPVTAVLVVALVGKNALDIKKRNVAARRQQAKTNIRLFLDDVQFEVGNELGELLRSRQRAVRDEFAEQVEELMRTYAELADRAKANAASTVATRERRIRSLRELLEPARRLHHELDELAALAEPGATGDPGEPGDGGATAGPGTSVGGDHADGPTSTSGATSEEAG